MNHLNVSELKEINNNDSYYVLSKLFEEEDKYHTRYSEQVENIIRLSYAHNFDNILAFIDKNYKNISLDYYLETFSSETKKSPGFKYLKDINDRNSLEIFIEALKQNNENIESKEYSREVARIIKISYKFGLINIIRMTFNVFQNIRNEHHIVRFFNYIVRAPDNCVSFIVIRFLGPLYLIKNYINQLKQENNIMWLDECDSSESDEMSCGDKKYLLGDLAQTSLNEESSLEDPNGDKEEASDHAPDHSLNNEDDASDHAQNECSFWDSHNNLNAEKKRIVLDEKIIWDNFKENQCDICRTPTTHKDLIKIVVNGCGHYICHDCRHESIDTKLLCSHCKCFLITLFNYRMKITPEADILCGFNKYLGKIILDKEIKSSHLEPFYLRLREVVETQ